MLKKILVASAFTISCLASASAVAEVTAPMSQKAGKVYFTGNLGYGKINEDVQGFPKVKGGFATDLIVGYHIDQMFGVELGYDMYPTQKFSPEFKGKNNYAYFLAGKATMDIQDHFKAYGRMGAAMVHHTLEVTSAHINHREDESKLTLLLGAGVSYAVNDELDINVLDVHGTLKRGDVPLMWFVGFGATWTPSFW